MHDYTMTMHKSSLVTVGVAGGTGYTGLETLRILRRHPRAQVVFATSEGQAGGPSAIPGLDLVDSASAPLDQVELVFLCLPHGKAAEWAERALEAGVRVVDLTADHRPGSGREAGAVYGLADVAQEAVADARLVANPGCYPTGVQLALLPLVERGLVDPAAPVVVNAASGVTGAGRTPKRELLFAEVAGDYRAYATGNGHRHLLEMRASLPTLDLIFQPHLLPTARGILETIYAQVAEGVDAEAVRAVWRQAYADAGTLDVIDGAPTLAEVVGTDTLVLGAADNAGLRNRVVTLMTSFDNLGKGAAGQAVQNFNLMMGFEPTLGLRF